LTLILQINGEKTGAFMIDNLNTSLIFRGGWVMLPLVILGLIGFLIFIERLAFFHRGQIRTRDFIQGIQNLIRKQRIIEALTVCEETPGPVARIIRESILFIRLGEDPLREKIQATALAEFPALTKRLGGLLAIARVAPLLGLLGTILGMYRTFFALQQSGSYANMSVLSQGMAEALITTATGLIIAVFAFLGHDFLQGRLRSIVHELEIACHTMLTFIIRDVPLLADTTSRETHESPSVHKTL
jgi:biopolymer transport protein ExbB